MLMSIVKNRVFLGKVNALSTPIRIVSITQKNISTTQSNDMAEEARKLKLEKQKSLANMEAGLRASFTEDGSNGELKTCSL